MKHSPNNFNKDKIIIQENDFDVGYEYLKLCESAKHSGAIVFFVGRVRDFLYDTLASENKTVAQIQHLELEHYPAMTEAQCAEIIQQARQKYQLDAVRLIHRVGKILASEQIVMVAVASKHREDAFRAGQWIMDFLKTRAPIWKKEVGSNGEAWLTTKESDFQAAEKYNKL